jgi:hypothetical protein
MKKIKILYKNHKTDLFKATLLNVFQFFLRGAPFGFLFMVMIELFAPIVDTQKIIYYLLSMLGVLVLNLILTYLSQMKFQVISGLDWEIIYANCLWVFLKEETRVTLPHRCCKI